MGSDACGVVRLDHKLEDSHDEYSRRENVLVQEMHVLYLVLSTM